MKHTFTSTTIRKFSGKAAGLIGIVGLLSSSANAYIPIDVNETPVADAVTSTFRLNPGSSVSGTAGSISITATYSQNYTAVANNVTATGMQFGAQQHTGGENPQAQSVWVDMANVSNAANNLFTSNPFGTKGAGVDVNSSYALSLFSTTRPLASAGLPTNGRWVMGKLRLTFSQKVTNPVLHIVGLGGAVNNLSFTTELKLLTSGVSMSKLSGNANLDVSDKEIRNSATTPDASSLNGAASGSVHIVGKDITTLEFQVYLRGDGGEAAWESAGNYNGDRWLLGFSFANPVSGENAASPNNILYTNLDAPIAGDGAAKSAAQAESNPTPLPIYVTGFTVVAKNGCGAILRWNTATEIGLSGFEVEHSADGKQFNSLAEIASDGQSGSKNYSYAADGLQSGTNYFRLHINNSTSQDAYSGTTAVNVDCKALNISATPNPATDILTIQGLDAGYGLMLMDASGRAVLTQVADGASAAMTIRELPAGLYLLAVQDASGKYIESVRISKQ